MQKAVLRLFGAYLAVFTLRLFLPQSSSAISLQPLLAGEEYQNEIAVNYGLCGDFRRKGYGTADELEANLTYGRTLKQRRVITIGIGKAFVDIDSPLITNRRETGIHGLIDYLYYFDTIGRWTPYLNSSLHKMSSDHFDRNEWTTYIGLSHQFSPDIFFFAGPGIEATYVGVKEEYKTFAEQQGDEVYKLDIEFAYSIGIFYRYNNLGFYIGNGPANTLGGAVSLSF